jgi:2-methylisocitrate lyase-like PEP mutase family enzyme
MKKTTLLRSMLEKREALVMVGAYDAISAILIERAGFKAIQCSGFGIAASLLGKPDVGLLSYGEMLDQTRKIIQAVDVPVMADGDTGFGTAVNVYRTVQEFEAISAAGVNLEDQVFPKRCGHLEGKEIVSIDEMVGKIEAAREARKDPDFIINARTDAIAVAGIDEAIRRGNAYAKAGADLIFVEAPDTPEQIRRVVGEIDAPISINLFDGVKGGKTPIVPIEDLKALGVARVSIPVGVVFAAVRGMENYLKVLAERGVAPDRTDLVVSFDYWKELVGFPAVRELEKRFLPQSVYHSKYGKTT